MKIKCEFCGNLINDTQEVCPHCGAPNERVRRSTPEQPVTIAQLQQWYQSKGLPPYEVTRFFIGQDYREPRAFGIYRDENTGHYIVYKNKDSGARAIRYEGTDEAYAVNELFQRLKQEITQQKANNVSRKKGTPSKGSPEKKRRSPLGCLTSFLLWTAGILCALTLLGMFLTRNDPETGYYDYQGTIYYCSDQNYLVSNWFCFDSGAAAWEDLSSWEAVPDSLETKKSAKAYYLGAHWTEALPCTDFTATIYYQDMQVGWWVPGGYYRVEESLFYYLHGGEQSGWYRYQGQWDRTEALPSQLQHPSLRQQVFLGETYSAELGCTDFTESLAYRDYAASRSILQGYYQTDDQVFYHLSGSYDEGWYSYLEDGWAPIERDALPASMVHPSQVEDFYFTPVWNSDTQFTDFQDSPYYPSDRDNWNDSDSDFDWDFGDSWDSGDTDWDSDW